MQLKQQYGKMIFFNNLMYKNIYWFINIIL